MGSVEDLHQFLGCAACGATCGRSSRSSNARGAWARCRPQVTGRPAGGRPRPRRPDGSHGPGARRPGDGPAADGRRSPAAPHDGTGGSPRRASVGSVCAAPRTARGARSRSRAQPGRAGAHRRGAPTLAARAWASPGRRADGLRLHRPMASCTGSGLLPTSAVRRRNGGARPGARACRGAARRFADDLGAFQDLLGRHQDAVVAAGGSRRRGRARGGPGPGGRGRTGDGTRAPGCPTRAKPRGPGVVAPPAPEASALDDGVSTPLIRAGGVLWRPDDVGDRGAERRGCRGPSSALRRLEPAEGKARPGRAGGGRRGPRGARGNRVSGPDRPAAGRDTLHEGRGRRRPAEGRPLVGNARRYGRLRSQRRDR